MINGGYLFTNPLIAPHHMCKHFEQLQKQMLLNNVSEWLSVLRSVRIWGHLQGEFKASKVEFNLFSSVHLSPLANSKGVLETYSSPAHKQQGGAGDLFFSGPQTARGCWRPILLRPTDSKGVLETYSTPAHKQQGGAGDLFYSGASWTVRGA